MSENEIAINSLNLQNLREKIHNSCGFHQTQTDLQLQIQEYI